MMMGILLATLASAGQGPVSISGAKSTEEHPVTCRRYAKSGSHVKRSKVCRTQSEWQRVRDAARETGRQMVEENRGRPPGS